MRSQILIYFAVVLLGLLTTTTAFTQSYDNVTEKRIAPVKGKKLVLKGAVRDGDEVSYRFKTRVGQNFTINLVGKDADFSLYLINGLDARLITEDAQSWSGRLPTGGDASIAIHSNYKLASYRLVILLK